MRTVRFGIRQTRLDKHYIPDIEYTQVMTPGNLLNAEQTESGAHFTFSHTTLEVKFLSPDWLFFGWDGSRMESSYAVEKLDWQGVGVKLESAESGWKVSGPSLSVEVGAEGSIKIMDWDGRLRRIEGGPVWSLPAHVKGDTLPGTDLPWHQTAYLSPEACVYGLGERSGRLNLRPGVYRGWNTQASHAYGPGLDPLYISIPAYLALGACGGCLVFYDNTWDNTLTLGETAEWHFSGGPRRYYIGLGSPAALLFNFTQLTGRAPLPPRWALGYHQSQWGYGSEREIRRIWKEFQSRDLPLSALYMDIDHLRGNRTLTLDEERYPTLPDFARQMRVKEAHLVAITNPGVKVEKGFDLYEQGSVEDVYCKTPTGELMEGVVWSGWTAFPDFTMPRSRQWWGKQYSRHLKYGIDGFWHDMNEPASFKARGDMTLPLCTRHDWEGSGADHRQAHNVYGLLMNRAGYEGLRRLQPGKRPFILSRSGWAGLQRYAWCWTGDIQSSWAILRQTPAFVLGLSLSGIPYCGPDIGGFSGSPSAELFVRWFAMSSFLPFFRTHSAFYLPRREPWEWGTQIEGLLRDLLKLRYRLLPYWYTLAWECSQSGAPLVRPLWWIDAQDPRLWEVDDCFLLGDELIVAPVLEEGVVKKNVILPSGGWYEWEGEALHVGPRMLELAAPLGKIPLLVRQGAIIPCEEAEGEAKQLSLHIYQPKKGTPACGVLYTDAGDGYVAGRVDRFSLIQEGEQWVFNWDGEGDFPWQYEQAWLLLHGFESEKPVDLRLEGEAVKVFALR